jgi:hypothetical protein
MVDYVRAALDAVARVLEHPEADVVFDLKRVPLVPQKRRGR